MATEEEDKEECGWCRWMKAGACKAEFEVWLKCVDDVKDAGRDDVETCASVMGPLWDCMQKNTDYYAPQLDALKGRSPPGESSEEQGQATKAEQPVGSTASTGSATAGARVAGEDIDLDLDNITDEDIERFVERLEKEEAEGAKGAGKAP
mmetsp:Transcript_12591/g.27201  ORF Transcript_12591/g.27201 Transcript_12591/m.27201 type:complete len:150 (+) Transcript_12591:52-501(+)